MYHVLWFKAINQIKAMPPCLLPEGNAKHISQARPRLFLNIPGIGPPKLWRSDWLPYDLIVVKISSCWFATEKFKFLSGKHEIFYCLEMMMWIFSHKSLVTKFSCYSRVVETRNLIEFDTQGHSGKNGHMPGLKLLNVLDLEILHRLFRCFEKGMSNL